jgi:excisionase family DNA binding protein
MRKEHIMANETIREVMDENEAADYLRLSARTLERWREQGRGPIYQKQGRRVTYLYEDLRAYLLSQSIDPATAKRAEMEV